jgi:hypothetical protein
MKKQMTFIVAFLLLNACIVNGQAGLANVDDIEKIKARTFLIMLEEPKEDLVAKLKPEEQERYKADIAAYNTMMKDLFPKVWTLSSKVDFKTRSEIMALIKAKDAGYAYLEYEKYRVQFANPASLRATFRTDKKEKLGGLNPIGGDYIASTVSIRLTEKANTSLEIISISLPSPFPTKGEMANAVKEILYTFDKRMNGMKTMQIATLPKKEAKRLANMTLLINSDDIDASEEMIKKVYPYPYEILSGKAKQDLAILSNDSAYAVIKVIPHSDRNYSYYVFAAADGALLATANDSQSTGVSLGGGILDDAKALTANQIKSDHFKLIANQVKDSIKFEK